MDKNDNSRKTKIVGIISLLVGIFVGLVILGWWLWPVQWEDATPEHFRTEFQEVYLRMAIDSYTQNQNVDFAQQRIVEIGPAGILLLNNIEENPWTQNLDSIQVFMSIAKIEFESGDGTAVARNVTVSPSIVKSKSPNPSYTPPITSTPILTHTPETTLTQNPTESPEPSLSPGPTDTPEPTLTPSPTNTPELTLTPRPTNTSEPTLTQIPTETQGVSIEQIVTYVQSSESFDSRSFERFTKLEGLGFVNDMKITVYRDKDKFIESLSDPSVIAAIYGDWRSVEALIALDKFNENGGLVFFIYNYSWTYRNDLLQDLFGVSIIDELVKDVRHIITFDNNLLPFWLDDYIVGIAKDDRDLKLRGYLTTNLEINDSGYITSDASGNDRLVFLTTSGGSITFFPRIYSDSRSSMGGRNFQIFFDDEDFDFLDNEQASLAFLKFLTGTLP